MIKGYPYLFQVAMNIEDLSPNDLPNDIINVDDIPDESIRRDVNNDVISPEAYRHMRESVQFFREENVEAAENEIVRAIELHPPLSPLYNIFGLLKIARRAIVTLKKSVYGALTTAPEFMNEFVHEGIQYMDQGQLPEAAEQFQKAISLNPNNLDARFRLGFVLISQKKYPEAVELFEGLIMADPQNINAFFMLGIAYSELRAYYPCIANLQHALRIEPAFVEARLTLADAYHNQGKYLISMRELDALEGYIPDEDTTYLHRGMILMELERFDEAVPYFEKVIELKPNVIEAYELLVGLYSNAGDFEKGVPLAEKALIIDPENKDLLMALKHMQQKKGALDASPSHE